MTSQALAPASDITGFDIVVRDGDHVAKRVAAVYTPNEAADTKQSTSAEKPGLLNRILEAIGSAYYVPTPDGKGIYVFPPI